ncbi:uncharacterized protein F4822DRAFT_315934 [Hypoxylon trugodes]|uniref:uncharacterized protein n=1 Tax=Hypoxylon trugodes TaxID=326681 RepID=UPI0021942DE8|nr:uncharacterized protein F4822DRAFT_315934 [Hypoxylon trugodes]KAI1386416.1 hypothetical protein F4822DRAFT_315934 [Hypoxylon trugodes]
MDLMDVWDPISLVPKREFQRVAVNIAVSCFSRLFHFLDPFSLLSCQKCFVSLIYPSQILGFCLFALLSSPTLVWSV